jgi:hypothetical protein
MPPYQMVDDAASDKPDRLFSGVSVPAFSRRPTMMKRLLILLACGMLGGIGGAAGDAPKSTELVEAPPAVITGYGVNGLVLWLAADSGVTLDKSGGVTALADKTGNFIVTPNDVDQEPTYIPNGLNNKPVLRFNGHQSLYSSDNFGNLLNREMTVIVVAMTTDSSLQRHQFPLYLGQSITPGVNRALAYLKGKEFFDGQSVGFFGAPVVKDTFLMTGAAINSTLTQATFYRNGAQTMVSNLTEEYGDAKFADLSDGVTMGGATDPDCGWQGDIAEELVYDHQLTPAEMQTVWFYLSNKYGLHQTAGPATGGTQASGIPIPVTSNPGDGHINLVPPPTETEAKNGGVLYADTGSDMEGWTQTAGSETYHGNGRFDPPGGFVPFTGITTDGSI